jgi:virulence factor Mce-like protein
MALFGNRDPRSPGLSPFKAGLIAAVVILVFTFFGFSRYNPFAHPFELKATFRSANNLQPKSPVRVAGIDVGKVTDVEPIKDGSGAAKVTMEIEKKGLPIHKDAELKIRQRIFLEGNFFVDLQPGTPEAPKMKTGGTIPVQQTATPVQFGQLLTTLQADTRKDLQTFLYEYAQQGLGHGGAQAYNKSLDSAPAALRYSSIANQASLGTQPHDLSNLLRGQQRLFKALSTQPETLKSLVDNLNITVTAFARQDVALAQTVPALRDVVTVGRPALASLNNALPSLRAFARDALPGTKSSGPTLDASLPFVKQARLLVSKPELRGLAADLKFAIPDLAKLNHETIPLLDQQRALSRCQNNVILPWAKTPIPDPDFSYDGSNNQPPYKEQPRGLVGLSGETRISDANTQLLHAELQSGPANVLYQDHGDVFVAQAPGPPQAVRPIRPDHRPTFRPDVPCETQQTPDMHAAAGSPDQTVTGTGTPLVPGLPIPPLPRTKQSIAAKPQLREFQDWYGLQKRGTSLPNPLFTPPKQYAKDLKQQHMALTKNGDIVKVGAGR